MPGLEEFKKALEADLDLAIGTIMNDAAQAGVRLSVNNPTTWNLVNQDARAWADQYTYSLVRGISQTTVDTLQAQITDWIDSGQHLDALVERIDRDSLFGRTRAEAIASTEVTRVFSMANMMAWEQDPRVEGKTWETAQDELVCPICGPLAGKTVEIKGFFHTATGKIEGPPAHVRCRCWLKPAMAFGREPRPMPTALIPDPPAPVVGSGVAPSTDEIRSVYKTQWETHRWFYEVKDQQPRGHLAASEVTIGRLSDQTGVHPQAVGTTVGEWNVSSNRRPMLQFQKDVGEVFGADFSDWQQTRWDESRPENWIADVTSAEIRKAGYENVSEFNKALAQTMYADTQAVLEEAGVDEVIVFRGITSEHPAVRQWYEAGLEAGAQVDLTNNNILESWTLDRKTAEDFAGMSGATFAMRVPRSRVFSAFPTGMGTSDEDEIVILSPRDVVDRVLLVGLRTNRLAKIAGLGRNGTKQAEQLTICFADGGEDQVEWIKRVGDGGKAQNEIIAQAVAHIEDVLAKWGWEL